MKRRELFVSFLSPSNGHFFALKVSNRVEFDTLESASVRVFIR